MARKISMFVLVVVLVANLCIASLIGWSLFTRTVDYVDNEGREAAQAGARLTEYAIDASIRNGVFSEEDYFASAAAKASSDRLTYGLYLLRNLQRNVEDLCRHEPIYYAYGENNAGDTLLYCDAGSSLLSQGVARERDAGARRREQKGITRRQVASGAEYYDYAETIYVRNRPWGTFHAGIPVHYVGRQLRAETIRLILYSVALAGLCAWLVYLAVGHWLSPLQALIADARSMTKGRLDVVSPFGKNRDELGELARAFNGMAATIRISMQSLESQVRERTSGLNTLIESSPAGLLVVDEKSGRILRANQTSGTLLNKSSASLEGRTLDELIDQKPGLNALSQADFHDSTELMLSSRQGVTAIVLARQVRIMMDGADCRLIILLDVTDRQAAWRAVEDSERRYRQLITQLNTAIVVFGADLRVQIINQAAMRLLQFRLDAIGRHCDELDWGDADAAEAPAGPGEISRLVREVLRGRMTISNRLVRRRLVRQEDDRRYWVLAGAVPIYDENGNPSQVVLSLNDVSELKQIQEEYRALSDKRRELESIIEHSDMTVLLIQLNPAKLEYVSSNVQQYGFLPEEIGQSTKLLLRMVAHEDRSMILHLIKKLRDGHCGFDRLIFRIVPRSGGQRWVEAGIWAREREGLGVTHLQAICTNITERKMLQDEVSRAYAVIQNSPDPIFFLDTRRRITYVNTACRKMFGVVEGILDAETLQVVLKQADVAQAVDRVSRTGESEGLEAALTVGAGRTYAVLVRVIPLSGETEEQNGIGIIINDLTSEKEAEKERQVLEARYFQSQKLESIGQLAAGIAHEINTPTQFVGDNLRFLQDAFRDMTRLFQAGEEVVRKQGDAGPDAGELERLAEELDAEYLLEESPKAISQSLDGIQRISDIVRAMKEFSHPGSGEMQPLDLNHAIQNTVAVARNEWKYHAEMVLSLDEKLPPVPCRAGEFNQVMLNLIVNSAHAVREAVGLEGSGKGTIEIRTQVVEGQWVEVQVRDTGSGIPEEIRSRVFDPFFTTKGVGLGTGQGLAIVYDVIKHRHRGEVFFESETGKGTCFHVRLPLVREQQEEGAVHG